MCYNIYIMKKYCFLIVFAVMFAMFFSACEQKETVEYVYHSDSPLTTMTTEEIIPEDTYSEYMATYTSAETTESDSRNYYVPLPDGISADTGGNAFPTPDAHEISLPPKDTAAAITTAETEGDTEITETAGTEVAENENTEETAAAEVTEESSETKFTVPNLNKPPTDTAYRPEISEDALQTSVPDETESDGTIGE